MSRGFRLWLFVVAASCVGVLTALAFFDMPSFGSSFHPYRSHAVAAAVAHRTANVVSSVNFDQRALDTLGEETILLGSVIGAAALLRPAEDEREDPSGGRGGRTLEATKLGGYVLLPVTMIVGADVVIHGHVTPGGGFQGGVVLATGLHLLYLTGRYEALERLRPRTVYEAGETVGAASFVALGVAGIAVAGSFLRNFVGWGTFGQLLSAGTVPVLNIAVGVEVGSGIVVLLAAFLQQVIAIRDKGDDDSDGAGQHQGAT